MPGLKFDIIVDGSKGRVALEQFANETDAAFRKSEKAVNRISLAALPEHERAVVRVQRKYQALNNQMDLLVKTDRISKEQATKWHAGLTANMEKEIVAVKKLGVETKKAGTSTAHLTANILKSAPAFAAATAAISLVYISLRTLREEFVGGLSALEDYNLKIASMSGFMTTFSQKTKDGDLAGAFKDAYEYSGFLVERLEILNAKTIATGEDLTTIAETFIAQGHQVNLQNKSVEDGFLRITNALKLLTAGQNQSVQMRQEIRALVKGELRDTNQLVKLLEAQDPAIRKNLKLWRQQGTIIENVGKMLSGFAPATALLEETWSAIGSTMTTVNDRVLRGGMKPLYEDLLGIAKQINSVFVDQDSNLTEFTQELQGDIRETYAIVKDYTVAIATSIKSVADVVDNLPSGTITKGGLIGLALFGGTPGVIISSLAIIGSWTNRLSKSFGMMAGGAIDFVDILTANRKEMETMIASFNKDPYLFSLNKQAEKLRETIKEIRVGSWLGEGLTTSESQELKSLEAQLLAIEKILDDSKIFGPPAELMNKNTPVLITRQDIEEARKLTTKLDKIYADLSLAVLDNFSRTEKEISQKFGKMHEGIGDLYDNLRMDTKTAELWSDILEEQELKEVTTAELAVLDDFTEKYVKKMKAKADETNKLNKQLDKLSLVSMPKHAKAVEEITRKYDEWKQQVKDLVENLKLGQKEGEEWVQGLNDNMTSELDDLEDKNADTAAEINSTWSSLYDGLESGMDEWVRSGKLSLDSFVGAFSASIRQIVADWVMGMASMQFDGTSGYSPAQLQQMGGMAGIYSSMSGGSSLGLVLGAVSVGNELWAAYQGNASPYGASLSGMQSAVGSGLYDMGFTSLGDYVGGTAGGSSLANVGNTSGMSSAAFGAWTAGIGTFISGLMQGQDFDDSAAQGVGAAGGAYYGAQAGSYFGPVGTAVGGIFGGALGALGVGELLGIGNKKRSYLDTDYTYDYTPGAGFAQTGAYETKEKRDGQNFRDAATGISDQLLSSLNNLTGLFESQLSQFGDVYTNQYTQILDNFSALTGGSMWGVNRVNPGTAERATDSTITFGAYIAGEDEGETKKSINHIWTSAMENIVAPLAQQSTTLLMTAFEAEQDKIDFSIFTGEVADKLKEQYGNAITLMDMTSGGDLATEMDELDRGMASISYLTNIIDQVADIVDNFNLSDTAREIKEVNIKFDNLDATLISLGINIERIATIEADKAEAIADIYAAVVSSAGLELSNAFKEESNRITEEHNDLISDYNDKLKIVNGTIRDLSKYVGKISSARLSMALADDVAAATQYATSSDDLAEILRSVRSGDFSRLDELDEILGVVSKPSEDLYETFLDYQRDYKKTYNSLVELENLTGGQLSVDEQTAATLESMAAAETTFYDDQLAAMDAQLDTLLGVDQSIMSLAEAIANFTAETDVADFFGVDTSLVDEINSRYLELFERTPDITGLLYWVNELATGSILLANLTDAMIAGAQGADITQYASLAVGTDYVPYDGMTAILHRGERVTPAAYNRSDSDNAAIAAELKYLRKDINNLMFPILKTSTKTLKLLDRWEGDSLRVQVVT